VWGTSKEEEEVAPKKKSYKKSNNYKKLNIWTSPGTVIKAVKILSPDGRKRVKELGFEQLLYVSLDAIENREIIMWLLNNA
jgi:hypothetical protein